MRALRLLIVCVAASSAAATIANGATVSRGATMSSTATIDSSATVSRGTTMSGTATIDSSATVSRGATMSSATAIDSSATVSRGTTIDSGAAPGSAEPSSELSEVAAYAAVTPGHPISFPDDYGSHPNFRTEWWYVTGWLTTGRGDPLGFQVTFFRTRPQFETANPSAFTAHQLLIAHCAISDPKRGRLWQDQRIRRAGLGLAEAAEGDTKVWIDNWSLLRKSGVYEVNMTADEFALTLELTGTQSPLLNGSAGVSRKGPSSKAASFYYSIPHMSVGGKILRGGKADSVSGEAWFDHEWSSDYLDPKASGWDWIGINLDDGAALMAFRIRATDGSALWAGGTFRSKDGRTEILDAADVRFDAQRTWKSPRTDIGYPVAWHVAAGTHQLDLEPLMNDQENDTRLSTGAVYWEGAVRAYEMHKPVGRGYLELTGYGDRLKLR